MSRSCLGCEGASNTDVVCERCSKDPFKMEEARKRAASLGGGELLEQLYKSDYAFLEQGQVERLWNDLLSHAKDQTPDFTVWRNRKSVELVPPSVKRVLEVGVGMGHGVRHLLERFPNLEIYGTDISAEAVERAAAAFKGHFAVAQLGDLPWNGLRFDAILMLEVLEHVEAPRTFNVLRWVHALLADAGSLILSVPLESVTDLMRSQFLCPHCGKYVNPNGHLRSYSELQPIRRELALSGFRVERTQGIAGGRYFGIPRQHLMALFPKHIQPMVMVFRCMKQEPLMAISQG